MKSIDSRSALDARQSDIECIGHIELYVANNHQAAHFYRSAFGLVPIGAPVGKPTAADRSSVALRCGEAFLVLTSPLTSTSAIAEHLRLHGEGVKDIALWVRGVDELFASAVSSGARPIQVPSNTDYGGHCTRTARIGVFGDVIHTLLDVTESRNVLPAGFKPLAPISTKSTVEGFDHVACALNAGELDKWVAFYTSALGFLETHAEQVNTQYSAMRSKVVQSRNGVVRFPLMEPAVGLRKSQIETFVAGHEGAGAQHIAFKVSNIVEAAKTMSAAVDLLPTPAPYYDMAEGRVGSL